METKQNIKKLKSIGSTMYSPRESLKESTNSSEDCKLRYKSTERNNFLEDSVWKEEEFEDQQQNFQKHF